MEPVETVGIAQSLLASDPARCWKAVFDGMIAGAERACRRMRNPGLIPGDLAHTALLRTMDEDAKMLRSAHPQRPLLRWCVRVCRNVAFEDLRRIRKVSPGIAPNHEEAPRPVQFQKRYDLSKLTKKQADVAVLTQEGLSEREVAERLGISRGAVRSRLAGIKRRMERRS